MKEKIVRIRAEDIPSISAERLAQMDALYNDPDFEVDTSDIPEWTEEMFRNAVRGKFYRPLKQQVTAKVDSDVLAWLKREGPGYQTRLNAILRRAMLADAKGNKAA